MKYIFENIIQTQTIFLVIEKHFENEMEKEHMINTVRDTIHHKLMDLVLDELDDEQKKIFLLEVEEEHKHIGLLQRLKEWIDNFEDKLQGRAKEAENELLTLIEI